MTCSQNSLEQYFESALRKTRTGIEGSNDVAFTDSVIELPLSPKPRRYVGFHLPFLLYDCRKFRALRGLGSLGIPAQVRRSDGPQKAGSVMAKEAWFR